MILLVQNIILFDRCDGIVIEDLNICIVRGTGGKKKKDAIQDCKNINPEMSSYLASAEEIKMLNKTQFESFGK